MKNGKRGNPNPSPATRFKPGNCANPGGRPKRKPLVDLLKAELDKAAHGGELIKAQLLVSQLVGIALSGDLGAMKLIFNYVEGMPPQSVDINVRQRAEMIAAAAGLQPDALIAEAERILQETRGAV